MELGVELMVVRRQQDEPQWGVSQVMRVVPQAGSNDAAPSDLWPAKPIQISTGQFSGLQTRVGHVSAAALSLAGLTAWQAASRTPTRIFIAALVANIIGANAAGRHAGYGSELDLLGLRWSWPASCGRP